MPPETVKTTLPPGEAIGLEPGTFAQLLGPALREYTDALLSADFNIRLPYTIWRKTEENAISYFDIPIPFYGRMDWDQTIKARLVTLPSVKTLLEYVWDRGEFSITLEGPNPIQRESWAYYLIGDLLSRPISRMLSQIAHNIAITTGCFESPTVTQEDYQKLQDELVLRFCKNEFRFVATCPIWPITGEPGVSWQLSDTVRIIKYTEEQRLKYLSFNHAYFNRRSNPTDELTFPNSTAILEITESIILKPSHKGYVTLHEKPDIQEKIEDIIDTVKLALTIGSIPDATLGEGIIICDDIIGSNPYQKLLSFKRERFSGSRAGIQLERDENKVRQVFSDLLAVKAKSLDLQNALWYWGRSSISSLSRDILLEATIGLESLLVPNTPGELSHRFRLHGAALLGKSPEETQEYKKHLAEIYKNRSTAAHGGSKSKEEKMKSYAHTARKYLALAIQSVTELCMQRVFDPQKKISAQIENKILERCSIRNLFQ